MATTSESKQGPEEANGSNGNGIAATAAAVGPEADLFARQDPLSLVPTMKKLGAALALAPAPAMARNTAVEVSTSWWPMLAWAIRRLASLRRAT